MDILAGAANIPWATLHHCFGASDDIPDLLRKIAAGSEQALEQLAGYMIHQGTLYEATPHLVPFLARIAASGVATVKILDLLGLVAVRDDADQDPDVRGKTRAALAGEITALSPLLADLSDEVRDVAAWALPQSLAADRLVPPLLERWEQETSPRIAASVLRGLSLLDPTGTAALAAGALASEDSGIRLIAASACVAGGLPWSGDLRAAALAWTADGALMDFRWSFWSGHPLSDLIGALTERGESAAAVELVTAALTRHVAPAVSKAVLWAASSLADSSRSAAPALIAPLISVAAGDDADASTSAILLLRRLGALAQAADELAVVAAAEGPSRRADWALTCLIEIGDPRCIRLLVRDQRHRPFALGALLGTGQIVARPPFTPVMLAEIRACLREELLGAKATPYLIGVIRSWGPAAEAAIPDLLAILPRHARRIGLALAEIAGATPQAVSLLRQAAAAGSSPDTGAAGASPSAKAAGATPSAGAAGAAEASPNLRDSRRATLVAEASLYAAAKLHTLTGDEEPLLAAIESALALTGYAALRAAEAARTLTPTMRLIPALTAALDASASRPGPGNRNRRELALALWHHCGDPAPALEIIAAELRADPAGSHFAPGAAEAAAIIGPAARPLIPAILPLLDSPETSAAAVQALLRIDPETHGGVRIATLAEQLLTPLGRDWITTQLSAVQVLGEIGLPRLPAHVVARLRELAAQDRRIVGSGLVQTLIRDDDRLRAAILDLIGEDGES
jgi:hypothetical protein